ncbi:ExeM/NucH family extracellular endonuclease [Lysobacter niastensis]|uniref:ExeM/NucH family extracellular endonuclease n=1 Tax=Lysobacter niastensis TaxID=380629 RepID=A0ABS0B862_9GAMM|nr:ExeM/NucH family extracellular endonuclease [Lysobacter niastensis]MBF6023310.1 ExeM/NucH family extracellular endonuclease [Lysobacter niastensis]
MPRIRPLSAALASCLLIGCSTAALSPNRVVAIGTVQGRDAASPRVAERVTVAGVVTLKAGGGWFLQDAGDGDDATSDALWVDDPQGLSAVTPGDRVQVSGEVAEQPAGGGTRTALLHPQVRELGQGTAAVVDLTGTPADWERYEGMSVRFTEPLNLDGSHELERRGRVLASLGERPWQASERTAPGSAQWRAVESDNGRRQVWLQATPDVWPAAMSHARTGSRLQRVAGVLDESDAGRGLHLSVTPELLPASRPQPPQVEGNLRVAALNLENLFNGDGHGGGFPTPRGARSPAELAAQLAKHVATLRGLDADVVALMELENDGYGPESSLASLVSALNADGGDWRPVNAGQGPGDNPIRVGLIYRAGRVRPQGKPATLEGGPFGPHSRVPMAQAFVPLQRGRASGPAFVVAANHFKSKGCSGAEGADRDQHDGAACWNATRTESARRLDAWLKSDPTKSGSDLAIIVGDLNAYAQESPVRTLADAGWRDAFAVAGVASPYSYVYDGRIGRLDHALLSPSLSARLRGAAEWHSNADEPETSGYRDGGDGPWRSSDHDPLLLGFDMHR